MGEMIIRQVDDALRDRLEQAAALSGQEAGLLARDLIAYQLSAGTRAEPLEVQAAISPGERERRRHLLDELRGLRASTLEPLVFDSTLIIREMRDSDG